MTALAEYVPNGGFIPVKLIYSAEDARKHVRETRERINRAGDAQRAKEAQKAAEEALKRELEEKAKIQAIENARRIAWKDHGIVLYNRPIGPPAKTLCPDHQNMSALEIVRDVARKHRVKSSDIMGAMRFKEIIPARREVCYILYEAKGWSMPRIGNYLDRDHTSVLHAIRCHVDVTGAPKPPRMSGWDKFKQLRPRWRPSSE